MQRVDVMSDVRASQPITSLDTGTYFKFVGGHSLYLMLADGQYVHTTSGVTYDVTATNPLLIVGTCRTAPAKVVVPHTVKIVAEYR